MFVLIETVILGIVEGLTEFLPVSSTGHLIVAERLLGFNDPEEIFTVVIQVGAIAAVIWYFRHDLARRVAGLFRREKQAVRFWTLLAIGTIPAGVLGLLIESQMEHIATPTVVAWALILGGIVLWLVDRKPVERKKDEPQLDGIRWRQAWYVGIGQCLALVPGVSRSGATIISGLFAGMDRATATAFSFYLSIPVLVLASGYKVVKNQDAIADISGGAAAILLGMTAAFFTALLAVAWLLRYISRHNFRPFAYYRIGLGAVILLWLGWAS
ncbi:MAG: undecaprenyl-diphosphate phosphatase [Candidatus Saccharimonadales bacterium]